MGFWFESRKGRGYRLRFSKPTVVKFIQRRPTAVYEFTYESPEGYTRVISGGVGRGRFKRGKEQYARELFERRLNEQFGDEAFRKEEELKEKYPGFLDATCEKMRHNPAIHQDNYKLVSVRKL